MAAHPERRCCGTCTDPTEWYQLGIRTHEEELNAPIPMLLRPGDFDTCCANFIRKQLLPDMMREHEPEFGEGTFEISIDREEGTIQVLCVPKTED